MPRPLVAGNWKMHGNREFIDRLIPALRVGVDGAVAEVAVCPPFVYLERVAQALAGSPIALGAQNLAVETGGAYTGEIAGNMLRECGCHYVIVGHSERRSLYGEDDALVARKLARALEERLVPILCVGERLEEREAGVTETVIGRQLDAVIGAVGAAGMAGSVVAYEPVWAIGTGRTATPEQAQAVHAYIRARLRAADAGLAANMRILYGGSVKADNAAELFSRPDIDGGLIGGASLKAEDFLAICRAARA